MSHIYNVFETQEEAYQACNYDYIKYMSVYRDNNGYDESTSHWAIVSQRATDGKWVYPVCPESDRTYSTEEYDTGGVWFPVDEEA